MLVDKHISQKIHFKSRLKERYGLECNKEEYRNLVTLIQTGAVEAIHLLKQSNRISVWWLPFKCKRVVVVYDNNRKTLVTALPPECRDLNVLHPYALREELD